MNDTEKRAHDIAVAVLPDALKELGAEYFWEDSKGEKHAYDDAVETYDKLYNRALIRLENLKY